MISTVFFVYNSSIDEPYVASLVAERPDRTILVLNILSQIMLHCLAELMTLMMDTTRWAVASRKSGSLALTFLVLSHATGVLGACLLSFGNHRNKGVWMWGRHRY